ncbi:MAG: Mfa1 family fimbria major subunit [Muribaculaceae bacterium]|nr:Mfa1 family fimbria major subunit [Muribaculaceae bacterium]
MNKASKFFAAFTAVALVSACSSEEPANGGNDEAVKDGQKAYLAVTINSTGDMGRSTDYDTPDYTDGSKSEHTVKSARFFFFDAQGNYVMQASVVDPAFGPDNGDQNIEWLSTKNILVLEDLTSNTYPEYMLTVLNADGFTPGSTISETTMRLSEFNSNFTENGNNFVMSTTAYYGEDDNHSDTYYNVTKLVADNFKLTPDEAQNNSPVDVYVERLAAKVQLGINAASITKNGKKFYKLEQTVAGGGNDQNNPDGEANTELYLEVLGWGLNATAAESYTGKQFDGNWKNTAPFGSWNNAGLFRSFWAYSYPYEAGKNADSRLLYTNTTKLNGVLTNDNSDYAQYCYENTNAAENIFIRNNAGQNLVVPALTTHVVLNTRICNAEGEALPMLNFRGTAFLENDFKAYVLNTLRNSAAGLNYYYLTGSTDDASSYTQVDVKDIVFEGIEGKVGEVNIKLADPDATLYAKTTADDGSDKYVPIQSPDLAQRLTALQGATPLYWYNKGANLYYIPVEHNATASTKEKEGYYGVVRNHWYKITVNSFSHIGHAVYDPDGGSETLKPDTPEDPLYYVGARINVLSWRIISQSVDL